MAVTEQVGIDVTMRENVSQAAGQASQAISDLKKHIEMLNTSMDPEKAEKYFDELNRRAKERQSREDQKRSETNIIPFPGVSRAIQQTGSTVSQLGYGGDASQAVGRTAMDAAGFLGKLGPFGMVAGGALLAGGASVMAMNAVAAPYEGAMEDSMDLAMKLGMYGDTAAEQSLKFVEAMSRASEAGSEFGYRMEEAASLMGALAERGAVGDVGTVAGYVMRFARGYGMQPGALADFAGTASRFGQVNSLERVAGMVDQQGLSPARFGELMTAQLSIFEDALSRGVVKGFDEIAGMQNMFAQAGEVFTGTLGAQRIRSMDSTVANASSMAREEDVILYRVMQDLMGGGTKYTDVMAQLEKGITPELFGAVRERTRQMSGGDESQQIELLRSIFGVNYTTAQALMDMDTETAATTLKDAQDVGETYEVRLLRVQEKIRNDVREISSTLIDQKTILAEGFEGLLDSFQRAFFDVEEEATNRDPGDPGSPSSWNLAVGASARYFRDSLSRDALQGFLEDELSPTDAESLAGILGGISPRMASYLRDSGKLDEWMYGKSASQFLSGLPGQLAVWGQAGTPLPVNGVDDYVRGYGGISDDARSDVLSALALATTSQGNLTWGAIPTDKAMASLLETYNSRYVALRDDEKQWYELSAISSSEREELTALLKNLIDAVKTPTEVVVE